MQRKDDERMVGEVKLSIKVEVSDEMVERLVDLVIKRIAALRERHIGGIIFTESLSCLGDVG